MTTLERIDVGPRISQVAVHNRVAYLAGQIPADMTADVGGQTTQVLQAIDALLERVGSDKTRILRAEIFLADIDDFAQMNAAWDAWVPAGNAPPRATVEARLALPQIKVEIVVTAALSVG